MTLQRCDGPECPECGCCDSDVLNRYRWGDQEFEHVACNHCDKRWQVKVSANGNGQVKAPDKAAANRGVVYHVMRCPDPQCGSKNIRVTSTRTPIRHHLCKDCGKRFKSVEG